MGRITRILLASAMLALCCTDRALGSPGCRCASTATSNGEAQTIAGRAHLVYRTNDREAAFEGEVTFLQRDPTIAIGMSRSRLDPEAGAAQVSADAAPAVPRGPSAMRRRRWGQWRADPRRDQLAVASAARLSEVAACLPHPALPCAI